MNATAAAPLNPVPDLPSWSARCEGLTLEHRESYQGVFAAEAQDEIRMLLVEAEALPVRVSWKAISGEAREAFIRHPEVCIVPAQRRCELTFDAEAPLTVISLERRFCDQEAMRQYGARFRIADCYVNVDPFVRRIGNVLVTGLRLRRPPEATFLESTARDLARHVTFTYGRTNNGARSKGLSASRLARVLAMIDRGLKGPLPLAQLAAEAHMSEFHFSRMFRYSTGYSPHTYVTLRRMDRAKELLVGGDTPLAEIAAEVGYKTQAHFTSVFHSYCGMTPGVYRRARGPRSRKAGRRAAQGIETA